MLLTGLVSWWIGRGERDGDIDPWWTVT